MKSAVLEDNATLVLRSREMPEPANDEYLIKIHGAGVCNSDIFRGHKNGAYHYPLVMGHELSGEVVKCGSEVSKFQLHQKVVIFPLKPCRSCSACKEARWVHCEKYDYYGSRCDGGFQEYLCVKEWNLLSIPEGVDPLYASLCEPVAVALRAANMFPSNREGNVAVIGAGFLGICSAIILKEHLGFDDITIIDRNSFKLEVAEKKGFKGLLIKDAISKGVQYSNVLEACGAAQTFTLSVQIAASQACVVWLGNIQEDFILNSKDFSSILRKEITIRGSWNSDYQGGVNDDWTKALKLIAESKWLKSLVTDVISLDELPDVLKRMHNIKAHHQAHGMIKTVVKMN